MRKWLAGWFGWISAWWARRADRTYPHYTERMRRTVSLQVTPGEPRPEGACQRCSGTTYVWPLAAILDTGVSLVGSVTACPECDSAQDIVQNFRDQQG